MNIRSEIEQRLAGAPVVPLVSGDDPDVAVRTAEALRDGGLCVIEVVMRSQGAQRCMEAILQQVDDVVVGAGTVLTVEQARSVAASGAQFVVCPGLVDEVAEHCLDEDLPIFPGTATAGEVQRAYAMGLREVKFFPAALSGGVPMLKALAAVFGDMRFMPTGGITAQNLAEYLALDPVIACGGSWLTPADAIARGDFAQITELARKAVSVARSTR